MHSDTKFLLDENRSNVITSADGHRATFSTFLEVIQMSRPCPLRADQICPRGTEDEAFGSLLSRYFSKWEHVGHCPVSTPDVQR
ncbi:hypothetical protein CEXT_349161 [Caerostris extrusa]|uniref:Uncharacterized protein n=1 Tax=Caerostris extrusa TaxID=172846 RepID=A0AAV4S5N2_CAEEX|nr:hypothetical protein CEXT_349161 [Caerostris extrusa]